MSPSDSPSVPGADDDPVHDVVAIGNAIVDVIAPVPEEFIERHGLAKGAMTLIDAERAAALYEAMPPGIEASGGSAANTAAGVASFGGRAAFIGKVRDDQLGEVFRHDLRAAGVTFDQEPAREGPPTARCLIQVTPDAERTLNTYLGVSTLLSPDDIDEALVATAGITYCEGYLWDVQIAKDAIRHAMDIARSAGRTVALTLSDGFCVDRHREEWLDLLADRVDLVFANEAEITSLFRVDDFEAAREAVTDLVPLAALTRGERGSVVVAGDEVHVVPAASVAEVVDVTGAGDLYAAGFLHGLAQGRDPADCARLGSLAAAEIISHMGARPLAPLAELV